MAASSKIKKHFPLLDGVRALAILMVVVYHYLQGFWGVGFLIRSDGIVANLARLQVFNGSWGWLKNVIVYLFAYSFSAVNVFVILSGFVLTWSALQNGSAVANWLSFYYQKFKRILLPFYISVLVTFILLALRNWWWPALSWWPSFGWWDWLKFLIPVFPVFDLSWLQQLNGDYWYLTLILQLYLLFPLLFWFLKKYGMVRFLLTTLLLTVAYRFLATYGYGFLPWSVPFLDSAPMGVISSTQNSYYGFSFFLPRLFEFAFGMGLAYLENRRSGLLESLKGWWKGLGFLSLTLLGFVLMYYRAGWIFSDLVVGIGAFGLYLNIGAFLQKGLSGLLKKISDYSFETYLLHHNFLNLLFLPILASFGLNNENGFWWFMPFYLVLVYFIGKYGSDLSSLIHGKKVINSGN